jgi:hypothetical protein
MRQTAFFCALAVVFGGSTFLCAQDTSRNLCDPAKDVCVDDTMIIEFDAGTAANKSIFEYDPFVANAPVNITIYNDTKTDGVQGWSYGIAHDETALGIVYDFDVGGGVMEGAAIAGTDAEALIDFGFDATSAIDIQTCLTVACSKDPAKNERKEGGGFISAVVLSFTKPIKLPLEKKSIVKAHYKLLKDVGTAGTLISVSDQLAKKNSPATDTNITVTGKSRVWTKVVEGLVKLKGVVTLKAVENLACPQPAAGVKTVAMTWAIPAGTTYTGIQVWDGTTKLTATDLAGTATSYTTPALANGSHTLIVRALSGADQADAQCTVTISDAAALKAVENLVCPQPAPGTKTVAMTWAIPAGTTYTGIQVWDGTTKLTATNLAGTVTSYTTPALANGSHTLIVRALKDAEQADAQCTVTISDPITCVDYALYFGPAATDQTVAVTGNNYVITGRNVAPALGFQLGVKITTAGATSTWAFADTLGADADRLIEVIITDDQGNSKTPAKGNQATSTVGTVNTIARGAAIDAFKTNDFFAFDLAPGVGGPGFTVGYVTDLGGAQNKKIAATGAGTPCPVNELLKVTLGAAADARFSRGDADGNGKLNVSDAVLIIQIAVGNLTKRFDCMDILDANDDGTVNITDAIPVLSYVFQKGPALPSPFKTCGNDTAADTLQCPVAGTTNCN